MENEILNKIEKTMREWIDNQLPLYSEMQPGQQMTTTQGEVVWKANPAMAEIRANIRDYCYVLKTIAGLNGEEEEIHSSLGEMKKKFKLVR